MLCWMLEDEPAGTETLPPRGPGVLEILGFDLRCLDVACYTALAFGDLSSMADLIGERETAEICRRRHADLQRHIESTFWQEDEGLYGDIVGTPREMIPRLRRWIEGTTALGWKPGAMHGFERLLAEAETSGAPDTERARQCRNWTVTCPFESGVAPAHRAARALARIGAAPFTGRWGMHLNGFARREVMSINTGALAMAELRYGRVDRGLRLVRRLAETLTTFMPGALPEISPDGGCIVQAWSGYGVVWPVVTGLFGLRPEAHLRRLQLQPRFPDGWAGAELRRVRIGDALFDFAWDGGELSVHGGDGWEIVAPEGRVRRVEG
jgi:glycogen debranching enzyme